MSRASACCCYASVYAAAVLVLAAAAVLVLAAAPLAALVKAAGPEEPFAGGCLVCCGLAAPVGPGELLPAVQLFGSAGLHAIWFQQPASRLMPACLPHPAHSQALRPQPIPETRDACLPPRPLTQTFFGQTTG